MIAGGSSYVGKEMGRAQREEKHSFLPGTQGVSLELARQLAAPLEQMSMPLVLASGWVGSGGFDECPACTRKAPQGKAHPPFRFEVCRSEAEGFSGIKVRTDGLVVRDAGRIMPIKIEAVMHEGDATAPSYETMDDELVFMQLSIVKGLLSEDLAAEELAARNDEEHALRATRDGESPFPISNLVVKGFLVENAVTPVAVLVDIDDSSHDCIGILLAHRGEHYFDCGRGEAIVRVDKGQIGSLRSSDASIARPRQPLVLLVYNADAGIGIGELITEERRGIGGSIIYEDYLYIVIGLSGYAGDAL